ncbi:Uncharacterised protein [Klebsiella pneumoniae]|nr:Uncharacterised protein [Klebsiella pneumoniae]
MAEVFDEFLHIKSTITKCSLSFLFCHSEASFKFFFITSNTDTFSATTSSSFNDDRIANFFSDFLSF